MTREGLALVVRVRCFTFSRNRTGGGRGASVDQPDDLEEEVAALLVLETVLAARG